MLRVDPVDNHWMNAKSTHRIMAVLLLLVAVEAIAIVLLLPARLQVVVGQNYITETEYYNPLQLALRYDSSDHKFAELVREYPELINMRPSNQGAFDCPILANCAVLMKTNYIRILIANGADVKIAINCLETFDAHEEVSLILQLDAEIANEQ